MEPHSLEFDPRTHRKTCKRYNDVGHAHALTFSCFRRQPFFSSDRSRTWMIEALQRSRERHVLHIWAYVIMPEHVHVVLWPTQPQYEISAILKTMKQSVHMQAIPFV